MTPEGKVKQKVDLWVKQNMPNAWRYSPPGGPFGNAGVGDRIFVWNATPIMIEVKADETCEPTALQSHHLKLFAQGGGLSCVLKGFQVEKLWIIHSIASQRYDALKNAGLLDE